MRFAAWKYTDDQGLPHMGESNPKRGWPLSHDLQDELLNIASLKDLEPGSHYVFITC